MKREQIYLMVNDIASEMYGEKAIAVKDTPTLVSFGDTILSSNVDKEKFLKMLRYRLTMQSLETKVNEIENNLKEKEGNWLWKEKK